MSTNLWKKSKKKIVKLVYGRTLLLSVLIILQIVFIAGAFYFLSSYSPYFYAIMILLTIIAVLDIFNNKDNPSMKMSWLILVTALSPVGCLFYLYVRLNIGHRKYQRKMEEVIADSKDAIHIDEDMHNRLQEPLPAVYALSQYTIGTGGYPAYRDTDVTYFPLGEDMFTAFLEKIRGAKKFIFLEFFIIAEGIMWKQVLDILVEKAREGVEVRLIYDGTNEFKNLPHSFPKQMEALGIRCRIFAPIRPFISTEYDYRDHRKIMVIDGKCAFTGGINLADEYINAKDLYGHWKDTAIMLEGEGVKSFTRMFLEAWHVTQDHTEYQKYIIATESARKRAPGYVIPYSDCPLDDYKVGETVYMDMINRAVSYVHIMTPYLVLDHGMIETIQYAARRGVDVRILLPHIPDKKYVFYLAKRHYEELMEAGVRIYEYTPGFVHAKVCVSDDVRAVVGTINFDYRSFYHHFECACYMEGTDAIADIEADFQKTIGNSHMVSMEEVSRQTVRVRIYGSILRLVAPLL